MQPENVLLTHDGHVCLTDFGLAKEMNSEDARTATLCGTTEYMGTTIFAAFESLIVYRLN